MARFPFCFSVKENDAYLLYDIECEIDVQHGDDGLIASDVYINERNLFDPLASTFSKQLGAIALEYAQDELDREGPLYRRAADSFEEDGPSARDARAELYADMRERI
mgnify:FL=1